MNTKTMRLPPRRISTTNASNNTNNNNKRKEKESGFDALQKTKNLKPAPPPQAKPSQPAPPTGQLLAGYLAHEFLTKGTLLGQPWDPSRAEPAPSGVSGSSKIEAEPKLENLERYVEVADLLKTEGAHLAGIVNPTQLARILQL
ncbi:hypothetical protein D8674_003328 [Pyrus ussuriensis x Pyrus communis]|uniref:Uncharacterized protein n=1 Tax=Pyrus ussuriensis x Pyrus communis TaxID=2448454 RepID=A0A5N5FHE4_9ROSA|nr:hypothetical protein D8674_003328 [Pyrus ussuriensis x Pyrus communis]